MPKCVTFSDALFVKDARAAAELHSRSLADQIMHWARIGRAIEMSGHFDHSKIVQVLSGAFETTVLTADEKAVWSAGFLQKLSDPAPEEQTFFADLQKSGKAVGLDASGKIVRAAVRRTDD